MSPFGKTPELYEESIEPGGYGSDVKGLSRREFLKKGGKGGQTYKIYFGITPQAATNMLTGVENEREQSKRVQDKIDQIR